MNLRDLKYLVTVADCKHFGKAAEKCFVSQPTLSMQIKKLEESLGIQLLERTNKSVMLTEVGTAIAERARKILQQADELRVTAKAAADPYSGEIKLGIFPTLAPYLLPHIVPSLIETFPKLTHYLVEEQTARLLRKLKQGKLDVAILALPIVDSEFRSIALFEEEFFLAVSPHHALAKRKTIKQNDLLDHDLLLLEEGHCLREQALSLCQLVKAAEVKNFRATSLETLRHMVASGVGITLIPKLAAQMNDGIVYLPFSQPKPMRTIGLLWRATSPRSALIKDMAAVIKKVIEHRKIVKLV